MRSKGIKFTLGNKEYELKFNMNTFGELEEVYGDINKAFKDLQLVKIKAIRTLLYAAIKVEDDTVTLKSVENLLQLGGLERLRTIINKALSESMPEIEENMGQ